MMNNNLIQQWYLSCINELREQFNRASYGGVYFSWVKIEEFPLPGTFYSSFSPLLITTPGSNIENHSGYNFYMSMGLKRVDGLEWRHLFEDENYNDLRNKGVARLSFHLQTFKPAFPIQRGDTLLDICQSLYYFLNEVW